MSPKQIIRAILIKANPDLATLYKRNTKNDCISLAILFITIASAFTFMLTNNFIFFILCIITFLLYLLYLLPKQNKIHDEITIILMDILEEENNGKV